MVRTPLSVENPITRLVAIAAAVALIMFGIFAFTTSTSVPRAGADVTYPVVIPINDAANLNCAELGVRLVDLGYLESAPSWTEAKIDPPGNGTEGIFTVTGFNAGDQTFDWSSTQPINIVYVKGGVNSSQIYFYNPATGATSGTGLTTQQGGGISHISACYGTFATTTTTTEATTTTTEATTTTTEATTTTTSVLGTTTVSTPTTDSVPTTAVSPTTGAAQAAEVLGTTQAASGQLPYTGMSDGWLVAFGAAVLLGGTALVMLARRRMV